MHYCEIEFVGLKEFIDFFEKYEIEFFFIEAMQRKADKTHSGGICQKIIYNKKTKGADGLERMERAHPFANVIGSRNLNYKLSSLQAFLYRHGLLGYDLYIKASPRGKKYYRTILIDDLKESYIRPLMDYYKGPIAIIETSRDNYQAILIVTDRDGLTKSQRLTAGRHFAAKFDGDRGPVSGNQLHRFPGSPNYKRAVTDGELPFITKLVMLRHSVDDNGELEMLKVLSRQGAGVTAGTQAGVKTHKARTGINGNGNGNGNGNNKAGPGLTWSEKGFRWVLKQLNKGVDDAQIAAGLHALFVVPHPLQKHAQDPHWIPRTIFNAKAIRAGSPLRYTSS